MYRRILVPVDGSHTSTRGLKEAVRLAKDHHARLKLLHVVDESVLTLNPEPTGGIGVFLDALIEGGKHVIKNARALAERHGTKAETAMRENLGGRVSDLILDETRKWRADIIVMGTHGRRGISHVLLGSDAEAVVRSSPVPVLLVRGKTAAKKRKRATR